MTTGGPGAHVVGLDGACGASIDLRTTERHDPHSAAPARAFWLVALTFTVILVGTTVPAPLYVVYQAKWGFSAGVLTLVFAIYSAGVLAALLLLGRLSDEIGRTRVLLAALAVSVASTLVFLFATGVPMLLARGCSRASPRGSRRAPRRPRSPSSSPATTSAARR